MAFEERYRNFEGFISPEALDRLFNTRVLICGCGAGAPVALHLARIGVGSGTNGSITIADPDVVEFRNIGRPPYNFSQADTGVLKVDALEEKIHEINSIIKVNKHADGVTNSNLESLVSNSGLVIEMVDISKPEITLAIHHETAKQKKPLVTGLDIGDNVLVYLFDYRQPEQISLEEFLGYSQQIHQEKFSRVNPFAVTAQLVIGQQNKRFQNEDDVIEYYSNHFFSIPDNISDLLEHLPKDSIEMVSALLIGNTKQVAQTDIACQLLGTTQALIVKNIILGYPVKTAPEPIKVYLSELIQN